MSSTEDAIAFSSIDNFSESLIDSLISQNKEFNLDLDYESLNLDKKILEKTLYEFISLNKKSKFVYQDILELIEKILLEECMISVKFNQSKAHKLLGISRSGLRIKLEKHFADIYFPQSK